MMARSSIARSAPRWGRQASIVQPHQPAFWLFCGLLAIGGLLFIHEQSVMAGLATAWLLSWVLVLAYAVPVALVIYRLDLFEREPKLMLAAALVWGGVVATSLATYANEAWLSVVSKLTSPDFAAQWGASIVGPGVEETLKLMGVVTLFLIASSEFDGVLDGFVYGAMVGLGFTVVEDVSYFINAAAAVPGAVDQSGPVLNTFLIRVVAGGLYGHVLFAGLAGMGFAYLVTQRSATMTRRVSVAGLCVAAGVLAHAVWNSPWMDSVLGTSGGASPSVDQWIEYGALKGMPFLILLAVLVMLATRNEERNYRAIVAGEPDPMVITESEIRSLGSLWSRWSARATAGRVGGRGAARLVGRLQAAQIEYAMIRSAADDLHDPALEAQRLKIRSIRAQLGMGPLPLRTDAPAPPAFGPRVWAPTHEVPAGGIPVWDAPHAARRPVARISEGVALAVVARAGAWAQVRDAEGRIGWVDGRLLAQR
jgi:RsiW-degrading membrane proteinase PrsW (M82 family)